MRTLEGHRDGVMKLCFSPDSQSLASGGAYGDGRVHVWRLSDGRLLADVSVQEPSAWERMMSNWKQVRSIDFSPNGQMIAFGGSDRVIYVISTANGQILKRFSADGGIILGVAFALDSREVLSADAEGTIITWKL